MLRLKETRWSSRFRGDRPRERVGMSGPVEHADWFGQRDDPDVRRQIVERYDGLAIGLAQRFRGRGEATDDLIQVARYGLLKTIDRFDVSVGVQFSTFATKSILGEMKRHLRDKAWSVRVPRSLQETYLRTGRAVEELTQRLGRSPTIAEIAHELEITAEEVLDAIDAGSAFTAASLDMPVGEDDGGSTLGDLLPLEDEILGRSDERVTVSEHLKALPERERQIIYLRFFEAKSQREVADELGISQMHVSRLLRKALSDLRVAIEA